MTTATTVEMPRAWEDHAGWEAYYAAGPATEKYRAWDLGIFDRALPEIMERLQTSTTKRIWIAGCGITPLGKLFALCGGHVTATDIAPSAIRHQLAIRDEDVAARYRDLLDEKPLQKPGGTVTAKVHDFAQPPELEAFDIVINQRAFQAFTPPTLQQVARAHFAATRPGGWAIFELQNVQGQRRDLVETTLVDAGFVLPLFETDRWHRETLDATGIPYVFILGMPCVPQSDRYPTEELRRADKERLRSIRKEYESRAKQEYERNQARLNDPATKLAILAYCTG